MACIHPNGSPNSRIWVILDTPLSTDSAKGYLMSGGLGFVFSKMMNDAGIKDYYVTARRPDTSDLNAVRMLEAELNNYKPPFIIAIGDVGQFYCEVLKPDTKKKKNSSQISKYAGSLLTADHNLLCYPHYIMPMAEPAKLVQDWTERNITCYFDMQKLNAELEYWRKHGTIQPLPQRDLRYKDMELDEILSYLERFRRASLLSVDIESVYTKKDSVFSPHPGYPTTISIADSPSFGVSFNFFRESAKESVVLWRELDGVLSNKILLGQNFFEFDAPRLRSLGFSISKRRIIDTKIRHHILWPELSHTLQFMTRQYTREVYYKDEGKVWNLKNMLKLRRYNALDTTVTFEVYEQQEEEFAERKEVA